jgi:hypothetical protein
MDDALRRRGIPLPLDLVEHLYGYRDWMIVDPLNLKALKRILEKARHYKFNHHPLVGAISFDIRLDRFMDEVREAIKKLDPNADL